MLLVDHFQKSPSASPALRVGVLLDSDQLIKPFADVLAHIAGSNYAQPVLRIYNVSARTPSAAPTQRAPFPARVARYFTSKENRRNFLWTVYDKMDGRFAAQERTVLQPVDILPLVGDVPRIDVVPITKRFVHLFPPESIEAIQQYQLDVILRFGFNVIRGDILKCARYGTWSYHHGDNDYYRGGPSPFWELVEKHPCSGVMLQILDESIDAGYVLCKGIAPTAHTVWVSRNRVKPYQLGTTFIIRKLFELHRDGFPALQARSIPPAPYQGKKKIYRTPSNWEMARFLVPDLARNVLSRVFRRQETGQSSIAFRMGQAGFRWANVPAGRSYASPFLFGKDGRVACFFEDQNSRTGRARISCGLVKPDATLADIRPVLEPDYHVSYPFVFEDGGEIYMIPESQATGTVDLYRAVAFPWQWEKISTLLHAAAVNTTVVKRDGYYWLFTSVEEPAGAALQLVLLYSQSLTGPFIFHEETVVCADSRYARGAGRFFEKDGVLVRPGQDVTGSCQNGGAIHFRRVTELSPTRYREEDFGGFQPLAQWPGTHVFDRFGDVEVIDGQASHATGGIGISPERLRKTTPGSGYAGHASDAPAR